MKVSTLRRISKFINNLIETGYDGNTDITTLLADMEFTTLPDNLVNILTHILESEQNTASARMTIQYSAICTMIATTNIEKLITISDELCITLLTSLIINLNNPLPTAMNDHIINYDYEQNIGNGMPAIRAYNTGYKVLHNMQFVWIYRNHYPCMNLPVNILENCIQNGLYIKNILYVSDTKSQIDAISMTDIEEVTIDFWHHQKDWDKKNLVGSNFKTIKSIKIQNIDTTNFAIHDVVSSLPSLRTAEFNWEYKIGPNHEIKYPHISSKIKSLTIVNYMLDGVLCKLFGNVEELRIIYCRTGPNNVIPNTVKKLSISYTNITNAMISACTRIKHLDITDNDGITTCASLGKKLTYLRLDRTTAINDAGLELCTNLKILHVNNNDKITTCAPFASSLKKLYADGNCCIGNNGLQSCSKIVMLSVDNNSKITTCAPFANSLVELHAKGSCGINDNGLKLCSKLMVLHATNNNGIRTCAPFADSLEILQAQGSCGIHDDGLKLCSKLKCVYASCNPKITTSLQKLFNTCMWIV